MVFRGLSCGLLSDLTASLSNSSGMFGNAGCCGDSGLGLAGTGTTKEQCVDGMKQRVHALYNSRTKESKTSQRQGIHENMKDTLSLETNACTQTSIDY